MNSRSKRGYDLTNFRNKLPEFIVEKYNIYFCYYIDDKYLIFETTDHFYGVLILQRTEKEQYILPEHLVIPTTLGHKSIQYIPSLDLFFTYKIDWIKSKGLGEFKFYNRNGIQVKEFNNIKYISFKNDYSIYLKSADSKYGILDSNLEITVEPIYEELKELNSYYHIARVGRFYGIISSKNEVLLPFEYQEIYSLSKSLNVLVKPVDNKIHLFSINDRTLTKLKFDFVLWASSNECDNLPEDHNNKYKAIISNNKKKKYGHQDIIAYQGMWGIIDGDGTELIPPIYNYIDFQKSVNYYKVALGQLQIKDNEEGELVIEGLKWGIIDKSNQIVIPCEFDWIYEIAPGLWKVNVGGTVEYGDEWWVARGGLFGVINYENEIIVPIKYGYIESRGIEERGFFSAQVKDSEWEEGTYDIYSIEGDIIDKDNLE